ncbi:MAG: dihydrolipoyllysine-residue acetyltransferase [Woeseiaceae bacterium]|nr:dihydrolipoyllysine-residue acetyltransferase [Woeseiaceae bacterium]
MATPIDIVIPDLGDFSDVDVIEVLVSKGDKVAKEDGLITLETDKAAMDVPAPEAGVIEELSVKVGDKVSTGDVIGKLAVDDTADDETTGDADKEAQTGSSTQESTKREPEKQGSGKQESEKQANGKQETEKPESAAQQGDAVPSESKTLLIPDLGDFTDVDVIEVHVSEGSEVSIDDPLCTLETDKAAMDVPSTAAGTIEKVLIKVGDKVSEGSEVAIVKTKASAQKKPDAKPPKAEPSSEPETEPPASSPSSRPKAQDSLPPIDEAGFSKAHASPSVRKLARELGVDLVQVRGSGPKKRILHDDVKAFVKAILSGERAAPAAAALPQVPVVDFAKFGEVKSEPLTRIQKISGPRLQASWINLPHVTQHDLADITELEARRQKLKGPAKEKGISLTPLAFIMKACIATLKEFPKANASLSQDGESLVMKNYYHLGFAADTDQGLMVPVIHDADRMDVYELAQALGELSAAARGGKLKVQQMQGASFTISSLGGIGGTAFTPIVNAPEVAILGVSRSSMQPVWNGSEFEPRLMLPISLSYDHRVIDGAYAVRFTTHLCQALADVDSLLEATP